MISVAFWIYSSAFCVNSLCTNSFGIISLYLLNFKYRCCFQHSMYNIDDHVIVIIHSEQTDMYFYCFAILCGINYHTLFCTNRMIYPNSSHNVHTRIIMKTINKCVKSKVNYFIYNLRIHGLRNNSSVF